MYLEDIFTRTSKHRYVHFVPCGKHSNGFTNGNSAVMTNYFRTGFEMKPVVNYFFFPAVRRFRHMGFYRHFGFTF